MTKNEIKKILFSLDYLNQISELYEERNKLILICSLTLSGEIVLTFSGQNNLIKKFNQYKISYSEYQRENSGYNVNNAEIWM